MWIAEKLGNELKSKIVSFGKIFSGEKKVLAESEIKNPRIIRPYGVYGKFQGDENVAVVENSVLGTVFEPPVSIESGELCLYSKGGSIVIKNNGDVLINGKKLEV